MCVNAYHRHLSLLHRALGPLPRTGGRSLAPAVRPRVALVTLLSFITVTMANELNFALLLNFLHVI